MGTSSSYKGPNGKNPLLPDDFGKSWADLKSEMSQFITGSRKNSSERILGKYVRANGGSQALTQRAQSAVSSLGGFIGFLNNVQEVGFANSFEQLKIDYDAKNPIIAFSQLANKLGASGEFKEDVVARDALLRASSELYELMDDLKVPFDTPLPQLPDYFLLEGVKIYCAELIIAMVFKDLGFSLEKYGGDAERVIERENEMRDYVKSSVDVAVNNEGINGNPEKIATAIIKNCFEIFVEER
ncbi:hypothetical protein [Enterococcus casseliflavus]|uniref:hypothetical protein n=1 Tax=Enterococcus casseliflavus TaxID=37734 RepID=UPI003D0F2083